MNHYVTVYVPHPADKPNRYPMPDRVATLLTWAAGGATITEGIGYWVNPSNQIEQEPVALVKAFFETTHVGDVYDTLVKVVREMLDLGEHTVAAEIDGRLHFWAAGDLVTIEGVLRKAVEG